jgi:hypothetical protein
MNFVFLQEPFDAGKACESTRSVSGTACPAEMPDLPECEPFLQETAHRHAVKAIAQNIVAGRID